MLCFDTSTSSEDRIADSNQHLVIGNNGSHLNPGLPFQVTFLGVWESPKVAFPTILQKRSLDARVWTCAPTTVSSFSTLR